MFKIHGHIFLAFSCLCTLLKALYESQSKTIFYNNNHICTYVIICVRTDRHNQGRWKEMSIHLPLSFSVDSLT